MPQEQKAVEQEDRSKKTKKQKFRDISSNTGDINIEDKVQFAVDAKRQGKNADEIFGMIMERTQMEIASKRKKELEKKFPPATVKKLLEDYLESESYQELVMETMSSVLTSIKAAKKRGEFNRTLQLNEQRQEQRKEQADKAIKNAEAQRQKMEEANLRVYQAELAYLQAKDQQNKDQRSDMYNRGRMAADNLQAMVANESAAEAARNNELGHMYKDLDAQGNAIDRFNNANAEANRRRDAQLDREAADQRAQEDRDRADERQRRDRAAAERGEEDRARREREERERQQ